MASAALGLVCSTQALIEKLADDVEEHDCMTYLMLADIPLSLGNSIGNTIGNPIGNTIGNKKTCLNKFKFPDKFIFLYGVWGTPRSLLDHPRHFLDHFENFKIVGKVAAKDLF